MLINKNAELTQCNEELLNKLNKYLDIPIVTMFYFMNHLHQNIIKLYLIYLMILHKTILYKQLYFYGLPMQKTDFIKNSIIFLF